MVNIIKCPGHKFSMPTRGDQPVKLEWVCDICKLTVHTLEAARELSGKPS